ncbi:MAG: ABC transporter ATP-binding protein [Deltaproteobacteria bacterium]|nr:MAG: ABC transporter ATP-binding protein [Deltaproteobacteria bacterium]
MWRPEPGFRALLYVLHAGLLRFGMNALRSVSCTAARDLMTETCALSVRKVEKHYPILSHPRDRWRVMLALGKPTATFPALQGIDFEVHRGETFGIIGANGAGKTTLLKIVAGISRPSRGEIRISGRVSALFDLQIGFHPDFTGRENVRVNGALRGIPERVVAARISDILDFSGLGAFFDLPMRLYSAGMQLRLGFSTATLLDPASEILVIDEVFAVGDAAFRQKCLRKLRALQAEGRTIVLASHALDLIGALCDRVLWLEGGRCRFHGPAEEGIAHYLTESREVEAQERAGEGSEAPLPPERAFSLTRVALLDAEGSERSTFRTNEPLTVRIEYEATAPVSNPLFRVQFHRRDGLFVAGTNTYRHGLDVGTLRGRGVLEVSFPNLPLLGGRYFVSVAVTPDEFRSAVARIVLDERTEIPIEVESGRIEGGGIVHLPCHWRHFAGGGGVG